LELSKKLSQEDLKNRLQTSSEELSKKYGVSVREMEAEWDNMYQKFTKLAGRMDRRAQVESPVAQSTEPKYLKRSDLLRGRKNV